MKIQITEEDIRWMAKKAIQMINEATLYNRMQTPNDTSYQDGFSEFIKSNREKNFSPNTQISHWNHGGKYRFHNDKHSGVLRDRRQENLRKIKEVAQQFSVVPFSEIDLNNYVGPERYAAPFDTNPSQFIVLDIHECKGPATEEELQKSIDKSKNLFTEMAKAVQEALPWKGVSDQTLYKQDRYDSSKYTLGEPERYDDFYDIKFDKLKYDNKSIWSSAEPSDKAAEIRTRMDFNDGHQRGISYKGKDSKQDFFQDYPESSFDNHVTGWIIVADIFSYFALRQSHTPEENIAEEAMHSAQVYLFFKYDEQYDKDLRTALNNEHNSVIPSRFD